MVKVINKDGDLKKGKQGPAVYQDFYGKQIRRKRAVRKDCGSSKQLEVQKRFKEGLAFAESLSDIEKETIIDFINKNGLKMTWHNYAKLISMAPVKVDLSKLTILGYPDFPASMQSWSYRNKVQITETLGLTKTGFPFLIMLQGNDPLGLHYIDFTLLNSGGGDLRFTKDDGQTLLTYGIEVWNSGGKTAKVWVRLDVLPANSSIDIFMYYRNPSAFPASDLAAALYG